MEKEKKYATFNKIENQLKELDLEKLLGELERYAVHRLNDHNEDKAYDVVGQVFDKLFTQERKWYDGDSLEKTLFGAVKSLCNNENKKLAKKRQNEDDGVEIENVSKPGQIDQLSNLSYVELKACAIKILKNHKPPPDYLEELIFECWIEGLTKQLEIASYLEEEIEEIRKGVKRLNRKLGSVKDVFIKMGYGKK
jgi:hypothetical protein